MAALRIRKRGDNNLRGPSRLDIPAAIRKAQYPIVGGHVYPFGIWPGRIERDAKWSVQAHGEVLDSGRHDGTLSALHDAHAAGQGFRNEDVAIGRDLNAPRTLKPGCEGCNRKTGRHCERRAIWARYKLRCIIAGWGRVRGGHITGADVVRAPRRIHAPVLGARQRSLRYERHGDAADEHSQAARTHNWP